METEENVVLRSSRDQRSNLVWCPACQSQVEMVTPEQAARIARVTLHMVYSWIEAESVHFIEGSGHLLICVPELVRRRAESEAVARQIAGSGYST